MAVTWASLIRASLLEIAVKASSDQVDQDETDDALLILRAMLDEWGMEGLLVPNTAQIEFEFAESKRRWSIGPSANDPDIESNSTVEDLYSVNYRVRGSDYSYPLKRTTYSAISRIVRDSSPGTPVVYVYEKSHPLSHIEFNRPVLVGDSLEIIGRDHFPEFEVGDQISEIAPADYVEALRLNLAKKLMPSYGIAGEQANRISRAARESKRLIKTRNMTSGVSTLDSGLITPSRYGMLNSARYR